MAMAYAQPPLKSVENMSVGLFDIEVSTCLYAHFCCPCAYGSLADMSETKETNDACLMPICLPLFCYPINIFCCGMCVAAMNATSLVKQILRNWNVAEDQVDCIKVAFCPSCVASQVGKEIEKRKAAGQTPQMRKGIPTQTMAPVMMQMVQPQYVPQPVMTAQPVMATA
eukprot:CAMPEP_0118931756 /NCGR_PEP_ID=MMETSP1169-20130426/7985_1 /TAXON_ID=36882 /ORGANISM="Pyramimonas obovata, Strain CCMP722" /LENGTH=168 /DNA_ID=CAMNT_0006874291 /DNA_START=128 /DNA_END=630 /DNA_ORIENTATION=+